MAREANGAPPPSVDESHPIPKGAELFEAVRFETGTPRPARIAVVREVPCALYVNRFELVTFMCSPVELERLAVGFLLNEEIITSRSDIAALKVREGERFFIDVELAIEDFELPRRRILTSGCTGGVTFADMTKRAGRIESSTRVTASQVSQAMEQLLDAADLYKVSRGVHTSALSDGERLLVVSTDVGRHNTLDKIRGACALEGIDPRGRLIASTGRISSEMISKAAKIAVPIVLSRTSPTALSVALGREWGVTVIGYVRRGSFNVYAGAERVVSAGGSAGCSSPR